MQAMYPILSIQVYSYSAVALSMIQSTHSCIRILMLLPVKRKSLIKFIITLNTIKLIIMSITLELFTLLFLKYTQCLYFKIIMKIENSKPEIMSFLLQITIDLILCNHQLTMFKFMTIYICRACTNFCITYFVLYYNYLHYNLEPRKIKFFKFLNVYFCTFKSVGSPVLQSSLTQSSPLNPALYSVILLYP